MTSRLMYEALLIELNKTDAPNILLEDFNYFANKSIYQYINKRYNIYDINQQTTDDLRVLKATARLKPKEITENIYDGLTNAELATYECILPSDYLHMLNCICVYELQKTYKCYNKGDKWRAAAKRLTADAYSLVLDNFWNRPTYKNPYYYIHNVNTNNVIPTNPDTDSSITKFSFLFTKDEKIYNVYPGKYFLLGLYANTSEQGKKYYVWSNNLFEVPYWFFTTVLIPKRINQIRLPEDIEDDDIGIFNINEDEKTMDADLISLNRETDIVVNDLDGYGNPIANTSSQNLFTSIASLSGSISNIERGGQIRYGNASQVRMEIRYGTDKSIFELKAVLIDYIKAPQNIRLTQEQLDWTEDRSQVLEYPDYVCQEIVNELVHIVMENIGDPKLQTHPIVSLSIANPAQQLTEPVAQAT